MRQTMCMVSAGLLFLAGTALGQGNGSADAKALVEKAIKAAGGADKLAKCKASTWSEKGIYYGQGNGIDYTGKYAVQWPDKFRMEIEGAFTIVINGDKGWLKTGEGTMELPKDQLDEHREGRHARYITTLLPVVQDPGYTLATLKETTVGSKPALGVKVSSKGHRDVSLYFDKESGLLVKSEWRAKDLEGGGKDVQQEAFYSNYKDVEGVKLPMKLLVMRDGRKYVEAEHFDVRCVEKLDDKMFGKP
jgi:outer membrane lipoprotein-sorting protein